MKKLLAFTIVALMAGSALAVPGMGVFFSNTDFTAANTNFAPTAATPFNAYLVLMGADIAGVGAYEVGIQISDPTVLIIGVTGTNGWTNFGTNTNHLAGFGAGGQPPLPLVNGTAVLATLNMMVFAGTPVEIALGPSTPSSEGSGHPAIAAAENVDDLIYCGLTTGPHTADTFGLVATLNNADNGLVATEAQSLSAIKALFD